MLNLKNKFIVFDNFWVIKKFNLLCLINHFIFWYSINIFIGIIVMFKFFITLNNYKNISMALNRFYYNLEKGERNIYYMIIFFFLFNVKIYT